MAARLSAAEHRRTALRCFWSRRTRTTRRWASAPPRRCSPSAGSSVQVVAVTDGEAAYPEDGRRPHGAGETRRDELAAAARARPAERRSSSASPTARSPPTRTGCRSSLEAMLAGFAPGTWCAATWRGDGHPDHEATGTGRRGRVEKRPGAVFLEYPIWMWHWALPDDPAVPWTPRQRAPLTARDVATKSAALRVLFAASWSEVTDRPCWRPRSSSGRWRWARSCSSESLRLKPPNFGYLAGMELAKAVVVVPAHNELAHLPRCLRAMATAAVCLPVPVLTVVVLDATDDGSDRLVGRVRPRRPLRHRRSGQRRRGQGRGLRVRAHGMRRRRSRSHLVRDHRRRQRGARRLAAADDRVRRRHGARRRSSVELAASLRRRGPSLHARLSLKRQGHNHIHGANMGFRGDAYWAVDGFRALPTGEDVELVDRFEAANMTHPPRRHSCRWRPRIAATAVPRADSHTIFESCRTRR